MQEQIRRLSMQKLTQISQQFINCQPEPCTLIHLSAIKQSSPHHDALSSVRHGATFLKTKDSEIKMIRKGGPEFNEYQMNCFKDYYQTTMEKRAKNHSFTLIEKIINLMKDGKSIEVIKSQYPHGLEIQVAYSNHINRWVLSNKIASIVLKDQEELNSLYETIGQQLKRICLFWIKEIKKQEQIQGLQKLLSSYTLCGKLSNYESKVSWYCLVKTEENSHVCEDLFNANEIITKYGLKLKLVKIKSMGVLNNEDQLHRSLNSLASSIYSNQCESVDGSFGRSRVYFVQTNTSKVIGGFDLLTFQDLIFNKMLELSLNKIQEKQSLNSLKEFFLQFSNSHEVRTPYPLNYYSELLKIVEHLITQNKIDNQTVTQDWFYLLKISLYFSLKRLSIDKYSNFFLHHQTIREKINAITLQEFGPVNCNIVIFYYLINPSKSIKQHFGAIFQEVFNELHQHFQVIQEQFNTQQISEKISSENKLQNINNTIRHYYLNNFPKLQQIYGLTRELHRLDLIHSYYKIILLIEEEKHNYKINDNIYPFSIKTIADAYRQTWEAIKYKRKLNEKYQEYKKVTDLIENYKNYDFYMYKHTVVVNIEGEEQSKDIVESIHKILENSNSDDEKIYYPFMARVQKQKKELKLPNIRAEIQSIIKRSYFVIETVEPEETS